MDTPIDHYGDGIWYDAEYVHIRGDIAYYSAIARQTQGPILELACGTGRLTLPMARAGATVCGVDLSAAMLVRAESKRRQLAPEVQTRLSFSLGDMRTLRLPQTFSAVILAFNTLMHMTDDSDLEAALRTAHHHLKQGGHFYLDLFTPFPDLLSRDPEGRFDPQQMVDPRTRARYVVTENNRYDPRSQINTVRFYYQQVDENLAPVGEERFAELHLRVIFPRELDHWLHLTGFRITEDWDDFEKTTPFTGAGGRRIVTAQRC